MKITYIILAGMLSLFLLTFHVSTENFKSHKWCVVGCGGPTGESNGYSSSNEDC